METDFELWECPPLRARITHRQCAVNQARARSDGSRGSRFANDLPPGRHECLSCPGLHWWATRTGQVPLKLRAAEVLADMRRKEALRRVLRGVDADAPPPAAAGRRAGSRRARALPALLAAQP